MIERRRSRARTTIKAAVARAARIHGTKRAELRRGATATRAPMATELPSWIHLSCTAMSCAVCQRSSGSFARQVLTTRSNAGGVVATTVDAGAGSDVMIEEIRDAWLRPENAFFPVAIS